LWRGGLGVHAGRVVVVFTEGTFREGNHAGVPTVEVIFKDGLLR
jgi:hypothetical protein